MRVKERCKLRRTLSLLLVMALVFGMIPAYAAETSPLSLQVSEEGPYMVGEEIAVDVVAPEGAAVYYTLTGDEPTENSTPVVGNTILVSAGEPGTVVVKVLAVVETESISETLPEPGPEETSSPAEDPNPDEGQVALESDKEQADQEPDEGSPQASSEEQNAQEPSEDDTQDSGEEQNAQEPSEDDTQTSGEQNVQEPSDTNNSDTTNLIDASLFRSSSNSVSSAAALLSTLVLYDDVDGAQSEDNVEQKVIVERYTASLELEFDAEANVVLLTDIGTPEAPVLAIDNNKNIFSLNETANISVTLQDGVDAYYTTDGSTPTTSSEKVMDGMIMVSPPDSEDGGIVTVTVVSAITSEEDTIYSETSSEVSISFYDTTYEETEDTFSLSSSNSVYYFASIENAFNAVCDENLRESAITLELLRNGQTYSISKNTSLFKGAASVTLDLNGHDFAIKDPSSPSSARVLTIQSSEFTLTDSKSTNSAVEGASENSSFDAATLAFSFVYLKSGTDVTTSIKNIKLDFSGKLSNAINMPAKPFYMDNVQLTFDSTSTLSTNILVLGDTTSTCVLKDSVVEHVMVNPRKSANAVSLNGDASMENMVISTSTGAVLKDKGKKQVVIDGGSYLSESSDVITASGNSTYTIEDGVFSGNLDASADGASIIIHGGYIKGTLTGNVYAENCQGNLIEDPESPYYGYTHYENIDAVAATVKVVDNTSGQEIGAATVSAEIDGRSVEDLTTATPGQTIVYTITCLTDYKVYGIAVNGLDIDLDGSENYTVNGDGGVATYHYTVPASDFTLTFKIGLTEEAQAGDDIVTVSNSGSETTYKSLSSAMGFLKDGDTLTLTAGKEIIYSDVLVFDKDNITLDLNGATLVMAAEPQSSVTDETHNILVSSGSLQIEDNNVSGNGVLTFDDGSSSIRMMNGIKLTGEGTKLSVTGGTITGLYASSFVASIKCDATDGTVFLSGGRIEGRIYITGSNASLSISDDAEIVATDIPTAVSISGSSKMTMSGGTIISGSEMVSTGATVGIATTSWVSEEHVSLLMSGGEIISENESPAIQVSGSYGSILLENGSVVGDEVALKVYGSDTIESQCKIVIKDNIKLKGSSNAVLIEERTYLPIIEINGGFFSCGDGSLPISDTYFVTYPNTNSTDNIPDKVLNLLKNKDSAGYVSLVDPDNLKGTYIPSEGTGIGQTLEYTYQDFEGASDGSNSGLKQLLETTKSIYEAGNGEGRYPGDAWSAFTSAYELAKRLYDSNRNANQDEIDYRAAALSKAMIDLTASTDIDPTTMGDGYYYINVGLWKSDMTTPSMSNGALDSTALLLKTGSEYKLSLNFGPTYQYTVYGHLLDFFIYNGEDVNEAKVNMQRDTEDGKNASLATEASYSNWYAGSSTSAQKTLASEVLGEDIRTDTYNLPGTVTVTLPYIGTTDDLRSYWVGMNVDAMGGYASAILMLSWGTLEAVPEGEIEDALYLSSTSVDISLHADGIRTAEVTANVLGSSGWTISCEEQIEDGQTAAGIATASVTGNTITFTAVKEGTSTFVVTASKDGAEPLTKEITVTVTNDAPFASDVSVSGSTARIDISGASLSGADDTITSTSNRISIDVISGTSNVSQAVITIEADTMTALLSELDHLEGTSPSLRFETDVGQLTLDYDVVENAASYGQDITLEIAEIDIPDIDGLSNSDFETAYELTMSYGGRNISSLGGHVTITVPWNEDVGYAYYVDGDELSERYDMTVSGGDATWITDHFSTWALSTDRNLMDVGITEGVYSVPIVIKQADAPSRDSMANDAVGDMVVADVDEDGVTYTMFLKARIGDELGGEPLRGHLLKMWYYAPDDTSRSNPIRATVVRTYEDRDMNGDMDTFPREVEVYQEGEPNEDYYIQVSVDAMGGDSALQDALVRLDWDNALDDGGEAAREGFEDEYAIEQVIDSGASVSRSDLSDWIDNENILLVQGRDDDLTARFDTDALEDLYDQTSSSIRFVLEEVKTSKLTDEQQETASDRPVYQLKLTSSGDNITDIGDGNVEVTLPYELDDGEVADGLVIWLLDEDGTHSKIKCSYSERGKTVSFDTTEFGVFVIGYDAEQIWENPFTDVKEDDWFYEAVKYVVQKGLFAGTSETTFEPNLAMTRGMLVTVLYRLEGTPAVTGSSTFADVAPGQYYTSAVIWATQNGIVSGYGNGYFGTNDIVSREQMATILFRYAKSKDYDTSLVKDIGGFTDSDQVASYAKRALQWAYANGIIGGTSETTLSPKGSATRSQVATILMRFDEKIIVPAQEKAAKEAAEAEK